MVHHAQTSETPKRPLLPRNPLARVALASVAAAVGAAVLLGVAAVGGLAPADARTEGMEPGAEIETKLYTITPLESTVAEDEEGTRLRVRVDVEARGPEPLSVHDLGRTSRLTLEPAGTELTFPTMSFLRYPEGLVLSLQPHTPEEAVLSWPVDAPSVLDGVTEVRVTVHQSEQITGSGGTGPLWVRSDKVLGSVVLPLEGS